MQTSNLMFTSWLLSSGGNYHHVAECTFYSNNKYIKYFHCKKVDKEPK